ncbi:MAG: NUDIX domain-containing protein [Clostridia bacterium]|nr:NUDIX domain-containing protein [Clostridia bacterium]
MNTEKPIRNSAKALIIKDGKMLAIRMCDETGEFYLMPGGGQESEELLPDTVCREVAEELGVRVAVKDLAFVIEGMRGERWHRVDLVFLCEYLGEIENASLHGDVNQIGAAWLDIATLNRAALYPSRLRRPIMNLYGGRPYSVYLGNESMGDAEIVD